jgi:NADPH-dependent 2,4-dienoyl-CoA reductase/sulfur reductase-like enzyme
MYSRRKFLKAGSASVAWAALGACATSAPGGGPKVVVVGGGYGGATAAKYVRMWSDGKVAVTLVERDAEFISCPLSNLVIGGSKALADITVPYGGLDRWGVRACATRRLPSIQAARTVKLAGGATLAYDRLILSPGVDYMWEQVPSLNNATAQEKVLHAWKAGPQTGCAAPPARGDARRRSLRHSHSESALSLPSGTVRAGLPGRPLLLDAEKEIEGDHPRRQRRRPVEEGSFRGGVERALQGLHRIPPNSSLVDVDVATLTAKLDFESVKADVLNVIPPQHAGAIARQLGMANANARFCQVDFLSYESTAQQRIHILGDAIQPASLMPKSGHMANQHAKVCASAVVALLVGQAVNPSPVIANTCYSYIDDKEVVHIASVHAYDPEKKTMTVVAGSGGLSSAPSAQEATYAEAWARNIWADMLT